MDYTFSVSRSSGEGQQVAGRVEVKGSNWIFSKEIQSFPLDEKITVHAGYWDTFFKVWVIPEHDVEVTMDRRGGSAIFWLLLIALVVVILAAVLAMALIS